MPERNKCKDCYFWEFEKEDFSVKNGEPSEKKFRWGYCHRYPLSNIGNLKKEDDWCGEFSDATPV